MNPDDAASPTPRATAALNVCGATRDAFMRAAMAERLDADGFTDALANVVASIAGVVVVGQGTPRDKWADLVRVVIKNVADTAERIAVGALVEAPNDEP